MPSHDRKPDGTFTRAGAKTAGKKGGQVQSEFKKFSQKIAQRKKCSPVCPIYDRCPAMQVSYSRADRACQFKHANPELRRKFFRLFFEGKEGLIDEITAMIYRHGDAIHQRLERDRFEKPDQAPPRAPIEADARLLMDFYRLLYGNKQDIELSGEIGVKDHDPELLKEIGDLIAKRRSGTEDDKNDN